MSSVGWEEDRSKFAEEWSFWSKRAEQVVCRFGTMPKNVSEARRQECRRRVVHAPRKAVLCLSGICMVMNALRSDGQVTYTDSFSTPINYLTNRERVGDDEFGYACIELWLLVSGRGE